MGALALAFAHCACITCSDDARQVFELAAKKLLPKDLAARKDNV